MEGRVSSDRSGKLLTDKAEREGGMQKRETGSETALMEVGGKLSVEEYEERSGLESGHVKKKMTARRVGVGGTSSKMTVETQRFKEIVLLNRKEAKVKVKRQSG